MTANAHEMFFFVLSMDKTNFPHAVLKGVCPILYTCHVENRVKCHALAGNVNGIWLYPSHVIHTWNSSFRPVSGMARVGRVRPAITSTYTTLTLSLCTGTSYACSQLAASPSLQVS